MVNGTVQKLNNGFISAPYAFLNLQRGLRKPSRLLALIESIIYSYQTNGQVCKQGYSTFADKLNCARSSIASAISKLSDDFSRMKKGMEKTVYEYNGNVELQDGCIRIEYIFFTEKFEIEHRTFEKDKFETAPNGKKRRVLRCAEMVQRYLSNVEILVLSLIYSYSCDKKHGAFVGTVGEIAGKLDVSMKSAQKALATLMSAELVFRHSKAVNGTTGQGKYVANLDKIRKLKKCENKKAKKAAKATSFIPKEIEDANARADFAKKEQDIKNAIRAEEDKLTRRAQADVRFDAVRREMLSLNIPLAKAELYKTSDFNELKQRWTFLRCEMQAILRRVGIDVRLYNFENGSWRIQTDKLQT